MTKNPKLNSMDKKLFSSNTNNRIYDASLVSQSTTHTLPILYHNQSNCHIILISNCSMHISCSRKEGSSGTEKKMGKPIADTKQPTTSTRQVKQARSNDAALIDPDTFLSASAAFFFLISSS